MPDRLGHSRMRFRGASTPDSPNIDKAAREGSISSYRDQWGEVWKARVTVLVLALYESLDEPLVRFPSRELDQGTSRISKPLINSNLETLHSPQLFEAMVRQAADLPQPSRCPWS
jgi:hypothetical protein